MFTEECTGPVILLMEANFSSVPLPTQQVLVNAP